MWRGEQRFGGAGVVCVDGNEEKLPQKTQAPLAAELMAEENLSLVLAVLVGSGLTFRISSTPDDCYQLIHDYLVS